MKLVEGITYSHEHVTLDLSGVKQNDDCNLNVLDETVEEFKDLYKKGVRNIIEVTNRGMGRDIDYIKSVAKETNMNILCSTGYYKVPFFPKEVYDLSAKELSKIMIDEIVNGIDGSDIKADIIGEIGTSNNIIEEAEKKVFIAGALAHVETGKTIITHTTLGTLGLEQIELLKSYGMDIEKLIISHVDLTGDIDYILRLIDKGANVAFDTIGKENYKPDGVRIDMLKEICKRGLSDKVLMSMDITRKSNLKGRGGIGYSYLLDNFIPRLLDSGISENHIKTITEKNIVRILN
ncbi:phosphotriesterase family protein [Clostridium algidicarnis]|uniref:phosphotriesterase family protein n=1 Tax=Clostridium algidicarnis TaxID=37659 RepID=UPI001C0C4961|nr:phosphotriesterase-related protein [Clostridium algidicarnis]MBU3204991.1 phosphotriesterase-related protein [Clostridium algidicarnis]MBU3213145.1 phosphotriesterase-related protein [Clostridium algidicarnis]MBU3223200.1 phosphotriesterase-related protein [Clostridium algidicarnis]